jgi:hypothetical protein
MDLSPTDRNRLTVAVVATGLLLPLLFIAGGRSADSIDTATTLAPTTTIDTGLLTDNTADAPANLEGPVAVESNGQGDIAYPSSDSTDSRRGVASFRRFPDSATTGCTTNLAPLGATITVRNLNNGMKTTCLNINIGPTSGTFDIVLNRALFEKIAELVAAPLPVEMSW